MCIQVFSTSNFAQDWHLYTLGPQLSLGTYSANPEIRTVIQVLHQAYVYNGLIQSSPGLDWLQKDHYLGQGESEFKDDSCSAPGEQQVVRQAVTMIVYEPSSIHVLTTSNQCDLRNQNFFH